MTENAPRRAFSESEWLSHVKHVQHSDPEPEYRAAMKACASVSERSVVALRDAVDTTQSKTDMLGAMVGFLIAEVELLERKLAKLEARPVQMGYRGVWKAGETYHRDELVTHGGNLWACKQTTTSGPHNSDHFQLAVKRGRA